MNLDPEALYHQLGHLVANMPDLRVEDYSSPANLLWLGRATVLVEAASGLAEKVQIAAASELLSNRALRKDAVQTISVIVFRALAKAELSAPATAQGSFIPVGEAFSALSAVSKVLGTATQSIMIVDPYADANLLTDFAVLAREGVQIFALADQAHHKPGLAPAAASWAQQYTKRPLEVRLAPARSLHDRLIIVDDREAWTLGQSFNALAKRAPTSLVRADQETAKMKVDAYRQIWASASPLT